jgi:iron complex transport system ATP-binding protein
VIEAKCLEVASGGRTRLAGIDFSLLPGEFVAVVGPNGAGKSTLLQALCGDLVPCRGDVFLDGERLAAMPARRRASRLAVLPQEDPLRFPFHAAELVLLGRLPHLRGRETARDHGLALEALERCRAFELRDRIVTRLSGGERQRVQLARVLCQVLEPLGHSRFLLLDEPLSAQDIGHQHALLQELRLFARSGAGVLAVLHDLNLAARYADRVVLMREGRVVTCAPPRAALAPARIRQAFDVDVDVLTAPDGSPVVLPRLALTDVLAGRRADPLVREPRGSRTLPEELS